ncbi:hypothetical protein TSTA_077180 [Talaromyces stipitatus ATCC 10500]|uniref:Metallo-beta-lactamase domain-containing protein n=1 Tax=Talaromyces stipitatus (strain ATCC 10500 / CBS 375.48 / QM 6759 / NRRL 1006) TaxID=441959 RepID=B8LVY5_TALSN|nr:uncharacterized protein TSTA_077180 [Talaromyces stipitatus ATCC 10500]EED24351.1 hypothetical protein TSTA_077180 [Talaromyces stipitatus ATCC 10500]
MPLNASFDGPAGAAAKVSIIDSGFRLSGLPTSMLLTPSVEYYEKLPELGSWSFLVESSKGRKVLFDLGGPSDISLFPPQVAEAVEKADAKIEVTRTVADILIENGIEPAHIDSVILSHGHWDHVGDITVFPSTTELVVGPGFKEVYYPGYPTKPDVELSERYFEGRNVREIDFSSGNKSCIKYGAFRAIDFFGDGSFFLLDTPGHAVGHIAGLARTTTSPDTFIFMGGDVCHHGGEIRPSPYLPIPSQVRSFHSSSLNSHHTSYLDGDLYREWNIQRGRKPNDTFFDPILAVDISQAIQSIKEVQEADAQDNVFFVFAHDMQICGVVDFFPESANNWKSKEWKGKALWSFLGDFTPAALSNH